MFDIKDVSVVQFNSKDLIQSCLRYNYCKITVTIFPTDQDPCSQKERNVRKKRKISEVYFSKHTFFLLIIISLILRRKRKHVICTLCLTDHFNEPGRGPSSTTHHIIPLYLPSLLSLHPNTPNTPSHTQSHTYTNICLAR